MFFDRFLLCAVPHALTCPCCTCATPPDHALLPLVSALQLEGAPGYVLATVLDTNLQSMQVSKTGAVDQVALITSFRAGHLYVPDNQGYFIFLITSNQQHQSQAVQICRSNIQFANLGVAAKLGHSLSADLRNECQAKNLQNHLFVISDWRPNKCRTR